MLTTRPATIADREGLLELVGDQDNFTDEEKEIAREVIDDSLFGRDDYRILLTLAASGQPIAFICYGPIPMTERSFDLYWIATAPAYARRGLASDLVRAMEAELGKTRRAVIYIDTSATDGYDRARSFYEKNGFQVAARLRDFYKTGDDKVIYRKEL